MVNQQRFLHMAHKHVRHAAAAGTRGTVAKQKLRQERAVRDAQEQHQGKKNASTRARQSAIRKKMRQLSNAAVKMEQRKPFGVRGKSYEKIQL